MVTLNNKIRTYSELIKLNTFEERFYYLKLDGCLGEATFGFDRYINQIFYKSREWKELRRRIIVRDNGCDLGLEGYEILENRLKRRIIVRDKECDSGLESYKIFGSRLLVHHMNPLTKEDILNRTDCLFDENQLITVSLDTHNAIHYGSEDYIKQLLNANNLVVRTKNDTCPWKK